MGEKSATSEIDHAPMSTIVLVAAVGAGAWLAGGLINMAASPYSYTTPGRLLLTLFPAGVPDSLASASPSWPGLLHVAAGVVFVATAALLLRWLLPTPTAADTTRRRRTTFAVIWLVMVLASYAAGTVCALALYVSQWTSGYSTLSELALALTSPPRWGVIWGWLPALIGTVLLLRTFGRPSIVGRRASSMRAPVLLAGLAAVTALAAVVLTPLTREPSSDAQPTIVPEPLPETVVYGSPDVSYAVDPNRQPDWCSENVRAEPGLVEAATGHRLLTVSVTNTGPSPCVLENYPDVAFDDGGGNAMDVLPVRGGSFLTTDPGVTRIVLDPGATAQAQLGWNAVYGQNDQSAGTILLAPHAGAPRQASPLPLDISNGQPVAVTAWGPPYPVSQG